MTKGEIVVVLVLMVIAVLLVVGIISLFTSTPGYHSDLSISMSYAYWPGDSGYRLEIGGNGNVSYDQFHKVGGGDITHEKRTGKVTPQQVEALVAAVRRTNNALAISTILVPPPLFDVLTICDWCPWIDLAFTLNGQSKRISYNSVCGWTSKGSPPQAVCDLQHQIAGISDLAVWATPTPGPSPTPAPTLPLAPTATLAPPPTPTITPPPFMATGDFGILSQEPCGPPCFLGIRPGITTFEEAARILQNAGAPCETIMPGKSLSCQSGGTLILASGQLTVDRIDLAPPVTITLGEFVARYGPPDSLVLSLAPPMFFYNNLQTYLTLAVQPDPSYTVTSGTTISGVAYLTAGEYQRWVRIAENYQQPWRGYGAYAPKMNP